MVAFTLASALPSAHIAGHRRAAMPSLCKSKTLRLSRRLPVRIVRAAEEQKEAETDVKTAQETPTGDGTFYNDERPLKPKDDLSPEFKKRLRDEYLSLGGSPNTAMGSNYFLWIIVIISVLAILSWALGYI